MTAAINQSVIGAVSKRCARWRVLVAAGHVRGGRGPLRQKKEDAKVELVAVQQQGRLYILLRNDHCAAAVQYAGGVDRLRRRRDYRHASAAREAAWLHDPLHCTAGNSGKLRRGGRRVILKLRDGGSGAEVERARHELHCACRAVFGNKELPQLILVAEQVRERELVHRPSILALPFAHPLLSLSLQSCTRKVPGPLEVPPLAPALLVLGPAAAQKGSAHCLVVIRVRLLQDEYLSAFQLACRGVHSRKNVCCCTADFGQQCCACEQAEQAEQPHIANCASLIKEDDFANDVFRQQMRPGERRRNALRDASRCTLKQ